MTYESTVLTNTFLACIAITSLVILAVLYRIQRERQDK